MRSPQRHTTPLLWTSLYCLILTATADTGCFYPNGTDRNVGAPDVPTGTSLYKPCDTVRPYSMCCRNSDSCLPNGLCQQLDTGVIWRESCSDQKWRSSACLKLCVSDTGTDHQVLQCPDQSWCCSGGSSNATACCEQNRGSWIGLDGQVTNVNPSFTSTSTSATQTPAPTPSSSSSATPPPTPSSTSLGAGAVQASPTATGKSNTGAIAGGVVGGVVALAVLAGGAWWFLRRKRKTGERREGGGQGPRMGYQEAGVGDERSFQYQMEKGGVHEVVGEGLRREELDASGVRSELGGGGVGR